MRLSLKNIGNVREASIELNGITVIAGENNTGKSTVGRALFGMFHGFYHIQEQIQLERIKGVERRLSRFLSHYGTRQINVRRSEIREIAKQIIENYESYQKNSGKMKQDIAELILQYQAGGISGLYDEDMEELIVYIRPALEITDKDIMKSVLSKKLSAEFNGQIGNIYTNETGEIKLQIKGEEIVVSIVNQKIADVKNSVDFYTEAIYLDDPLILDEILRPCFDFESGQEDHQDCLRRRLSKENQDTSLVEELITNYKFQDIYDKLSIVCDGDIVRDQRSELGYKRTEGESYLDVRNLSTGLKTFAILKMLLVNGIIEDNGTVILDEPEIHLHPEWQLLFAELIVLLHKEFSLHVLLNTHSPYFLNAIEVYTAKYGVDDRCKYYLASAEKDGCAYMKDVTEQIELIYRKLARPLQTLENERNQDD